MVGVELLNVTFEGVELINIESGRVVYIVSTLLVNFNPGSSKS